MIKAHWYNDFKSQEEVCQVYRRKANINRFARIDYDDLKISDIGLILTPFIASETVEPMYV